jgi:uncharacterized membrane protein (DUF485 family)
MATSGDSRLAEEALHQVDWEGIERSPEFQELVRSRRRFVVPATIFFLAWYLGFIALCGYAPDFMGKSVYQGLTVGYVLALTQFVMVAVLGIMYLRRAERIFDPLSEEVARLASERDAGPRFEREPAVTQTEPEVRP